MDAHRCGIGDAITPPAFASLEIVGVSGWELRLRGAIIGGIIPPKAELANLCGALSTTHDLGHGEKPRCNAGPAAHAMRYRYKC